MHVLRALIFHAHERLFQYYARVTFSTMDTVIARAPYWNNTGLQLHASEATSEQFTHIVMKQQNVKSIHTLNMLIHLGDTLCCTMSYVCMSTTVSSQLAVMDMVYMGVSQCMRF